MAINLESIQKLPKTQKIALVVFLFVGLGAAYFYVLLQPRMKELGTLQKQQADLSRQIQESKRIADNISRYRKEYEQLKIDLDHALTELPNQKEIPSLLTSITSKGKEAGLDFLVFRPRGEVPKDFYAEVPVDITVHGSFYNVGNFFLAVSSLPRIVNISNVNVAEIKETGGKMVLKVNCLATTFRFLDKKEIKDEKKRK
jgi:type IV pilus assembly protein PilO